MQNIDNQDFISYGALQAAILSIFKYLKYKNKQVLLENQANIKKARDILDTIKTPEELSHNIFIKKDHGVLRGSFFLLHNFGECYLNSGTLTIHTDDPIKRSADHSNTYKLISKNEKATLNLYTGNARSEDNPYDFDTEFVSQITHYYTTASSVDTTKTAFDSFKSKYITPKRKIDLKTAFWKQGHEHDVDYIIKINKDGTLTVFNTKYSSESKNVEFIPADKKCETFLTRYKGLAQTISYFKELEKKGEDLSWEAFILDEN